MSHTKVHIRNKKVNESSESLIREDEDNIGAYAEVV